MTDFQRRAQVTVRSGGRVIISGQYRAETFDGQPHPDGSEATMTKGEKAPPTPAKGLVWALVDASRHKGDAPDTPPDEGQP